MPAVTGNHYTMAFMLMFQVFQSGFAGRDYLMGETELQGKVVLSFRFPDAQ